MKDVRERFIQVIMKSYYEFLKLNDKFPAFAGYNIEKLENLSRKRWASLSLWSIREEIEKENYAHWNIICNDILSSERDLVNTLKALNDIQKLSLSHFKNILIEIAQVMIQQLIFVKFPLQNKSELGDCLLRIGELLLRFKYPYNNWQIFKYLVNFYLHNYSVITYQEIYKEKAKLEEFLDKCKVDCWYKDGLKGAIDYYNAYVFYFYLLMINYVVTTRKLSTQLKFSMDSQYFLKKFTMFFDGNGLNVPFGRSLSYGAAVSAIFPAFVLSTQEDIQDTIGDIFFKNVDWHYKRSRQLSAFWSGKLGRERYISDSSAWWSFKIAIALLIPKTSNFWRKHKTLHRDNLCIVKTGYTILRKRISHKYTDVTNFYFGAIPESKFGDVFSYYGKFAYSSSAGFHTNTPDFPSLDNEVLLMDKKLNRWHRPYWIRKILDPHILGGYTIKKYLTPYGIYNLITVQRVLDKNKDIRLHFLFTFNDKSEKSKIKVIEGSYPLPINSEDAYISKEDNYIQIANDYEGRRLSVFNVKGYFDVYASFPRSHVYARRTLIPVIIFDSLTENPHIWCTVHDIFKVEEELPNVNFFLWRNKIVIEADTYNETFDIRKIISDSNALLSNL